MSIVRGLALVVTACAAASLAACTAAHPGPDHYYHNFETAAAKAPSAGYTVYWLGMRFQVGGVTYSGPTVADFGYDFDGGGLGMAYEISEAGKPPGGDFLVSMYTPAAWRHIAAEYETPYSKEISFNDVVVAGRPAKLVLTKYLVGPQRGDLRAIGIVEQFGVTTVVVHATDGVNPTPGAETPNPLMDEQTFLSVVQHLRPYPQ